MKTSNCFGRTRLLLAGALLVAAGHAQAAPDCNGNQNVAAISQAAVTSAVEGSTFAMSTQPSAKGAVFTWSWVSGPIPTFTPSTGETINITAPMIPGTTPAVMRIRLTASGCNRPDATATLDINITQLANIEPVAVATASPASVNEGGAVTLSAAGSYDPDNDPITYAWTQVGGPAVTINNASTATANFVAPSVSTTTSLTFRLKVTENTSAAKFSTKDVIVNVLNVNVPPTAALSCPAEVDEGALVTLDGSASNDPDSGVLGYSFSQLTGLPLASIPPGPYGSSVSFNAPALGFGQTGLVKFGLTVTDGDGASASADCSVFINDVTKPVLSGGGDQTLEATSSAGAVASYSVTSYDNVDGAGGATCVPPSGSTFALGATPVACAQSDSSGNIGELGFTITVRDTTAPVIAAHGDVTEEATSAAGAIVSYTAPATSDAYDGPGSATCAPPSGSQFPLGTTAVACNATDSQGNVATATGFNVKVQDTVAPEITAPADITVEATGPLTTVALVDATATDAVGPVTISNDAPAQFLVGTTVVTWTATDGAMNSSSTTSNVNVLDSTPPVVDDNADQTLEATSAAGAFASFATPTAHDLVDGDFAATCDHAPGVFALGTTTVTCSATDAHGNTGSSSFDITVQDTTPPVIAGHGNESAEATSAAGAIVSYSAPATSDAVDGAGVATCAPASGSQFALGDTTVLCDAVDAHGNQAVQTSFTVSVVDTTPPVIAAHGNETAEATSAAGAIVTYSAPATSDAVDGAGVATCAPASGSQFALGDTTVLCDAVDAHGNHAEQTSFTVSVVDTTPPSIAAHGNEVAEATGPAGAAVSYTAPTATDLVDGAVSVTCLPASGSTFALGDTTVNCSATDAAGNPAASQFTVTVRDTTPPVIAAHGNVTREATGPAGAAVNYGLPTASDLVDGTVAVSCLPANGSTFALGTTTVNCTATDTAGNTGTSSFSVTVQDTTAPVISAHANVTAEATGPTGAAVTYANPTATDLVDGSVSVVCTPASGSTFALGTTTVNCSATDNAGNTASSSFSVTVQDTTPPSISAHADVTAIATSASGAVVNYTLPTATDLVDGSVAVTCLPASGSTFAVGSTTVNCSATDSHGNTGHSSFNVIVSYAFTGFFKPIDNLPVVNVVKAGQGIPVKFSLGGNMGLNIFAAGYPRSVQMVCNGAVSDVVEETVTAGGSSLNYDATTGQYIYVWKSEKAWAGTCRQLQVKLADGTYHYANFNFTR